MDENSVGISRRTPEPAQRPDRVDLDKIWQERSTQFRTGGDHITVLQRMDPARREELVGTALANLAEKTDADGWLRLEVTFQDSRHAEWALCQLSTSAEALARSHAHHPTRPRCRDCHPLQRGILRVSCPPRTAEARSAESVGPSRIGMDRYERCEIAVCCC